MTSTSSHLAQVAPPVAAALSDRGRITSALFARPQSLSALAPYAPSDHTAAHISGFDGQNQGVEGPMFQIPNVKNVYMYPKPIPINWSEKKLTQIARDEMGIEPAR